MGGGKIGAEGVYGEGKSRNAKNVKIWQASCLLAVNRNGGRCEPLLLHNIRIFGTPIFLLCFIQQRISDN